MNEHSINGQPTRYKTFKHTSRLAATAPRHRAPARIRWPLTLKQTYYGLALLSLTFATALLTYIIVQIIGAYLV